MRISELEIFFVKFETLAQVLGFDGRIGGQFLGRAVEQDTSFVKQICTVCNTERLVNVMVGDEDTDVTVLQVPYHALNLLNGDRIDTGKRFVEKNKAWFSSKGAGYFNSSSFTTG